MKFINTTDTPSIKHMRKKLYRTFTAPIDAMWEALYIASSQSFLIMIDEKTAGYCCISEDKTLLQLYLDQQYLQHAKTTIEELITAKMIVTAQLSAIEPVVFSACLTLSTSIQSNTFLYNYPEKLAGIHNDLDLQWVRHRDIPTIQSFFKEQISFDDTFGYTKNLVDRSEIYMIKKDNKVIATSECRWSDSQPSVADLGVIVHQDEQGQGLATRILQQQAKRALDADHRPICSTTTDNLASQKAIEKAGFYCSNIIFDIKFMAKSH